MYDKGKRVKMNYIIGKPTGTITCEYTTPKSGYGTVYGIRLDNCAYLHDVESFEFEFIKEEDTSVEELTSDDKSILYGRDKDNTTNDKERIIAYAKMKDGYVLERYKRDYYYVDPEYTTTEELGMSVNSIIAYILTKEELND